MKKLTFEEKITVIKSYTDTDLIEASENKKIIVAFIKDGKKIREIEKSLGVSRQRVWQIIDKMVKFKLEGKTEKKEKRTEPEQKTKKKKLVDKASVFVDADLSCLSKRELQIVSVVLENPTVTYEEIRNRTGISVSQVGSTIWSARKKILGKWDEEREKTRERASKYARSHPEKERERRKKYYYKNRDKWIDHMKEYNKKYYAENRERILQKQKEKKSKEQ